MQSGNVERPRIDKKDRNKSSEFRDMAVQDVLETGKRPPTDITQQNSCSSSFFNFFFSHFTSPSISYLFIGAPLLYTYRHHHPPPAHSHASSPSDGSRPKPTGGPRDVIVISDTDDEDIVVIPQPKRSTEVLKNGECTPPYAFGSAGLI